MTEHSTKIYLWPSSVLNTFVKRTPDLKAASSALWYEPRHEQTYANKKGADQPAHPRSLISAFVVRCLESIIPLVSISEISSLYLASAAESTLLANPEDRFSRCRSAAWFAYPKRSVLKWPLPAPTPRTQWG